MFSTLKKFRNAHWFRHHLYAYKNLWKRRRNLKRGRRFLYNAELFMDSRCNLKCVHCSISKFQTQPGYPRFMSLDQIVHIADELKSLDCFSCCLVGGEATMRRDFLEVVAAFHQRQILPTVITNGAMLDEDDVRQLKRAGIFNIGVSLNGANAQSHDKFVQREGAFENAKKVIAYSKRHKICTSIAVVPTRESLASGEFHELIMYAVGEDIRVNVNYPALAGELTGSYDDLLTPEEVEKVREYFKLRQVTSDFTVMADEYECPAGRKKIYILPDGSVCPCTFIHISFGNVLQEPLREIMDRIWSTKMFMCRPDACVVSESVKFNEDYLAPVFRAETLPLYYKDHPLFRDGEKDFVREDYCHRPCRPATKGETND